MAFLPTADPHRMLNQIHQIILIRPLVHSFRKCLLSICSSRPFQPTSLALYGKRLCHHVLQGQNNQGSGWNESTSRWRRWSAAHNERADVPGVGRVLGASLSEGVGREYCHWGWQREAFLGVMDTKQQGRGCKDRTAQSQLGLQYADPW